MDSVKLNCSSGFMGVQHFARRLMRQLSSFDPPLQGNSASFDMLARERRSF